MKRAILTALILAAAVSSTVWAAPTLGIKGGLNLANLAEDPPISGATYGIRPGVMVGLSGEMALIPSNRATLRGEVLYTMKGAKLTDIHGVTTVKTDEVVIAPFLNVRIPYGIYMPFVEVGPEVGLNLTHKFTDPNGTFDLPNWSSMDWGINIGAGVAVPFRSGEVTFDARYNIGMRDMNTSTGPGSVTDKSNGVQFLVGYNFNVPTQQ